MSEEKPDASANAPHISRTLRGESLYQELCQRIAQTVPHVPLASARKLSERYGVSLSSARRVMERLCREGRIYQIQGKGSFVAESKPALQPAQTILYADTWMNAAHPFRARRMQGMIDAARESGMRIQVEQCPGNMMDENTALAASLERDDVCALVVPWLSAGVAAYLQKRKERLRVVVTTHDVAPSFGAAVGVDFYAMGVKAAAHLRDRGCAHVAMVSVHPSARRGFETFVSERGWDCRYAILQQPDHLSASRECVAAILAQAPAGLFFDDDCVALAVLDLLAREHPGFISERYILSHANAGGSPWPCPVTSLTFDGYEVGRAIVRTLQSLLSDPVAGGLAVRLAPTLEIARAG